MEQSDDGSEKRRRRGGREEHTPTQVCSLFCPGMNRLPSALTVANKGQRKREEQEEEEGGD